MSVETAGQDGLIDGWLAPDRAALLRLYAEGGITWHDLQHRGFDDYVAVLGGLGALGLRPPIAPMEGPNVALRERGRALLRQALRDLT